MACRVFSRAAVLVLVAWPALHGPGSAQGTESVDSGPDREDSPWHWEIIGGFGQGVDISSAATYLGDVRFVGLAPQVGRQVGRRYAPDRWFAGDVHLHVELPVWISLEPQRGFAAGSTLLVRYLLAGPERLRPFAEVGAGPIYLGFDNDRSQSDGLSFTLQTGTGVKFRLTGRWAISLRADLHHISNAGLRKPNPGINDLLFTAGIVWH